MVAVALLAVTGLFAQEPKAKTPAAPNPVLAPVQDVPGLPRVLLIGDSISMGYTLPVRELLKGKANVHRIPVNGGPTINGLAKLKSWLGDGKWDVIHFNFGIHDAKFMEPGKQQVPPVEYEKNLREIVKQLKATGAKVIWATSTPIPDGELVQPRKFDNITYYNTVAQKVVEETGVAVDDLNAAITPHLKQFQKPHDVHYLPEGSDFLAKKVAESIQAQLPIK